MGECLIIRAGGGTDTSDATATSSVVLSGFTCYVNDELVTGSMTNRGSVSQSLNPGGSYTIPEGYHDGTGSVGVTTLASNTSANAAASQILTGYNGWVNGANVSGSMANRGNVSQALGVNGSYTIPAGWHAGGGKVTQSLATQGAVNVTPGTANKTACAANRWTTGTIVILGSSSLTAGNIRNGVTIFGVKGTFTGWVDSTMPISAGCDLVTSANYREWWSNEDYIQTNAVAYGSQSYMYPNRIQSIYNAGFRYINAQANVTTYTNIGSHNTYAQIGVGVRVCWIWMDGTVHLNTLSRDVRDHQNPANNEVELVWTRGADSGTFTNNVFVKKLIYGNYNSGTKYWAIGTIVSVYVTDNSGVARAMCKLNSFNSWFSKS